MSDLREFILQRLQDCVAAVTPTTTFTFPGGMLHAPLVNDLTGRVFNKMRAESKVDGSECPFVEIITDPATTDPIEIGDDDLYYATTRVKVWGYQRSGDQGDSFNSTLRAALNSLRSDLIVAISAFPFWAGTNAGQTDPLFLGAAPGMSVTLLSQWTDIATDTSTGTLVLELSIRYPFNKRFP
jgi:hypothetical protein